MSKEVEIVKAVQSGNTAAAAMIANAAIMERISGIIDARREFITKNLFKESTFKTKEGNSAEIKGPDAIPDAKKKANGAKIGIYKEVEDAHELDGIEQMKDDTKPIPDSEKKGKA